MAEFNASDSYPNDERALVPAPKPSQQKSSEHSQASVFMVNVGGKLLITSLEEIKMAALLKPIPFLKVGDQYFIPEDYKPEFREYQNGFTIELQVFALQQRRYINLVCPIAAPPISTSSPASSAPRSNSMIMPAPVRKVYAGKIPRGRPDFEQNSYINGYKRRPPAKAAPDLSMLAPDNFAPSINLALEQARQRTSEEKPASEKSAIETTDSKCGSDEADGRKSSA